MLRLYNTFTRKQEAFKPINKNSVGMYTCGPTVYSYQHIGNLRSYIFADILRKVLAYGGYKVKHIINITDVGHLTSDADTGEDKLEKAAAKEKKTAKEIAEYYFKIFKEDFKKLNIEEPTKWAKATDNIKEMTALIEKLKKRGYTYQTSDGIYFDTSKFKSYGKLAKLKVESLKAGARVEQGEKKNKTDFALWKFSGTEKRQQEWKSKWGTGFPGWHIECSAMSMKYLGEHFDIHTGGEDHIPVHHTNEIAQSEAATGKKFVNYWMHGGFLTFQGEKISKSKGGLYTITELEKEGFDPLAFRYLTLTAHYKKQLAFSIDALKDAQNSYKRLKNLAAETKDDKKTNRKYLQQFKEAIDNDLDMPAALAALWNMLRDKEAEGKKRAIKEMDKVFGLSLLKKEKASLSQSIQALIDKREKARKDKNWAEADKIRNELKAKGIILEDTPEGAKWHKE